MQVSDVYIYGNKYRVKSDMDVAFVESVAGYVDNRMKEIQKNLNDLTTSKVAIMAAFDIAAELMLLRNETEKGLAEIDKLDNKIEHVLEG